MSRGSLKSVNASCREVPLNESRSSPSKVSWLMTLQFVSFADLTRGFDGVVNNDTPGFPIFPRTRRIRDSDLERVSEGSRRSRAETKMESLVQRAMTWSKLWGWTLACPDSTCRINENFSSLVSSNGERLLNFFLGSPNFSQRDSLWIALLHHSEWPNGWYKAPRAIDAPVRSEYMSATDANILMNFTESTFLSKPLISPTYPK